ncbi:AsnC family transcriptional regulator [Ramlibacter algicola]|uniref:AsnC family transcriptional regulator n=1 Tax=Ramlibacter algicola TaxID=2795217 RepID=A0A934Q2G4_9BURK|nr:AsnC family transcriptional regulator [Ramlibacter algicola]MBK0393898.1 AsnC family transcriptional regulator [Ramlibacter algicola]
MSALAFCLGLHRAGASLQRKLDEDLGFFHGIGWDDFVLMSLLDTCRDGVPLAQLAQSLRISPSAALRRLPPLEKTGLVARERSGGLRAVLRPGGARLVREARETAAAICEQALRGDTALPTAAGLLERLATSPALRTA